MPSGTVTFLFTGIEGSTRLWQDHPDAMQSELARHDDLVRAAIAAHGGHLVETTGDGAHAVFATAVDAVDAAIAVQVALASEAWSLPNPLRVRAGIHSGPAELRDGDYCGTTVNKSARIMGPLTCGDVGRRATRSVDGLPAHPWGRAGSTSRRAQRRDAPAGPLGARP